MDAEKAKNILRIIKSEYEKLCYSDSTSREAILKEKAAEKEAAMRTARKIQELYNFTNDEEVLFILDYVKKCPVVQLLEIADCIRDFLPIKKGMRPLIGAYYILDNNPEFDDYAGLKVLVEKGPRNKNTKDEQYRVRYGDGAFDADWIDLELFANAKLTNKDDPYIQPEIIP